jgi:hypothetical protein
MFGIDMFNYGTVLPFRGENVLPFRGENDYATIDDYDGIKYWCIEGEYSGTHEEDGSGTKKLWVNGISDVLDWNNSQVNEHLNGWNGVRYENSIVDVFDFSEEWVEDCTKAKLTVDEQNNGGNGNGNGNGNETCSDTNQETNDDGTCGDCSNGYVLDDDESSANYGNCIEEEVESNDMMLYGGIIGLVGLVVIVSVMKKGG